MSEFNTHNSELNKNNDSISKAANDKYNEIENIRKRKTNMENEVMIKQLKNNYWTILDNDKNCDEECLKNFEKHVQENELPTTSSRAQTNMNRNKENISHEEFIENNIKHKKKQNDNAKVPPLNIFDVEPNEVIKFIRDGLKIKEFKIKEFNNKKTALFMANMEDYIRVKAYLEKSKTKFFTYTPKEIKTKTFLLKGLSAETDVLDIYDELCKFQNDNLKFIKVSPFTTKKSITEGYKLPIYLVQTSNESKVNELKAIKGLLYRCVSWEALRKPVIPQCRNCQNFFHSASNCFLPHRCVKCNERHDIGKCSLSKISLTEKEKLYCVLCKKYGHPASYKGCDKYKEVQQKLRSKNQSLVQMRSKNSPMQINPNLSFADILKNNNPNSISNTNPIQNALDQLNHSMQNLSNQILNLNNQLQIQISRIDSLFSILEN